MQYYAFDQEHASRYGVPEAIMLAFIKQLEMAERYGRKWAHVSIKELASFLPFWTENQIRRTLKSLETQGAIVVGHYSDNAMDRTTWYSVNDAI